MLPNIHDYDALTRAFRWPKLAHYNIGVDVCDKWAEVDANRLAILNLHADVPITEFLKTRIPTAIAFVACWLVGFRRG